MSASASIAATRLRAPSGFDGERLDATAPPLGKRRFERCGHSKNLDGIIGKYALTATACVERCSLLYVYMRQICGGDNNAFRRACGRNSETAGRVQLSFRSSPVAVPAKLCAPAVAR